MAAHVNVKFVTKRLQYAIDSSPVDIPTTVEVSELNAIVNRLLEKGDDNNVDFDFLVDGEFLRTSLGAFIAEKQLSTESVLEIEYVEQQPSPQPKDSLLHDDWVSALQASNDFILTGSYDNNVRIWNTESDLLITIPGHSGPIKCVAWLQNEDEEPVKRCLTGSHDETILYWEWNQQKNSIECVLSCRGHAGSVDCIAVDPSKKRFCSGSWDQMLKIWSTSISSAEDNAEEPEDETQRKRKKVEKKLQTRVPLLTLSGHKEAISSAAWLNDRELCTASWDHSIRIWDIEQAAQKTSLAGSKVFLSISYSPVNGLLVAASADRHIRLYDPRSTEGAVTKSLFTSHTAWVSAVCWSQTSQYQFISGSYDHLVKLWDCRSPKAPLYDLIGHEDKVLAVDWTMPQNIISGGADNKLKIFSYSEYSGSRI